MTDKASIRQQTAETLRAKHRERMAPGQFEGQDHGLQALDCLEDLSACLPGEGDVFTVIADLVDPTCQMLPVEFRDDSFICSECREMFFTDGDGINRPVDWGFCPSCGARVLE